jgi:hypothetical protein
MWSEIATVILPAIAGLLTSSIMHFGFKVTDSSHSLVKGFQNSNPDVWKAFNWSGHANGVRHSVPNDEIYQVLPVNRSSVRLNSFPGPQALPFIWQALEHRSYLESWNGLCNGCGLLRFQV